MNRWERIEDRPDISVSEEMVLAAVTYGAHTIREVADMTGFCYGTVPRMLLRLRRAGYIVRPSHGIYAAVEAHRWPGRAKRAPVAPVLQPSALRPLTAAEKMGAHVRRTSPPPTIPLAV